MSSLSHAARWLCSAAVVTLAACINTSHELELSPAFDDARKEPRVPLALSLSIQSRREGAGQRDVSDLREEDEHDAREDFVRALRDTGRFSRIDMLKRSARASEPNAPTQLELRVELIEIAPARGNFTLAGFLFYLFPVTLHEREMLHATARGLDGRERSYDLSDAEAEVYWLPLLPVGLLQIACGVDAREGVREHLAWILVDRLEQDGVLTPGSGR